MKQKTIPYANGSLQLVGPAGLTARLQGLQPVELTWETTDRRVLDLELQIQLLTIGGGLAAATLALNLNWQFWSVGHGSQSYDFPPFSNSNALGPTARVPSWPIPARGVRVRLSGRATRLVLMNRAAAATFAQVQASLQPVQSSGVPVFPLHDVSTSGAGFPIGHFPMGSREWRVMAPPLEDIVLRDFAGAPLAGFPVPASTFADWTPIPLNAYSWVPTLVTAEAVYR